MEQFLTTVTKDVDTYWTSVFEDSGLSEPRVGYAWIPAGQAAASACGGETMGDSAAAYCPADDTIYISEKFATDIYNGALDQALPGSSQGYGRTVGDIWRTDGEDAFRAMESDALREALEDPTPSVIAAAGGTVLDPRNRRMMDEADAVVIWLRADPETLAGRVRHGDHRPLLDDDAAGTLQRLADERLQLYTEVADAVIDVDDLDLDEVAARVLAEVEAAA